MELDSTILQRHSIPGSKNDDGVSYQITKREYEERFGVLNMTNDSVLVWDGMSSAGQRLVSGR